MCTLNNDKFDKKARSFGKRHNAFSLWTISETYFIPRTFQYIPGSYVDCSEVAHYFFEEMAWLSSMFGKKDVMLHSWPRLIPGLQDEHAFLPSPIRISATLQSAHIRFTHQVISVSGMLQKRK
jgi:hypothetical protein